MIELHPDFREFLRLLNSNEAQYLLIGGYAVAHHGYPRATGGMDIWVGRSRENADRILRAVREFGMPAQPTTKDVLLEAGKVLRMGMPPVRIELITGVSGLEFDKCFEQRETITVDGIPVHVTSLGDLKTNKKAAGRLKDLDDLRHLQ